MSVAPSLLRSLPGTLFLSSPRVRCHRGVMCRPPRLGTTLRRRTLSLTLLCTFSQLPLYAFAKLNCLRTYLSYARSISCYFGSLHFGNYCGDPYLYVFVVCRCGGRSRRVAGWSQVLLLSSWPAYRLGPWVWPALHAHALAVLLADSAAAASTPCVVRVCFCSVCCAPADARAPSFCDPLGCCVICF